MERGTIPNGEADSCVQPNTCCRSFTMLLGFCWCLLARLCSLFWKTVCYANRIIIILRVVRRTQSGSVGEARTSTLRVEARWERERERETELWLNLKLDVFLVIARDACNFSTGCEVGESND